MQVTDTLPVPSKSGYTIMKKGRKLIARCAYYVIDFQDTLARGIKAARYAQRYPGERERLFKILTDE